MLKFYAADDVLMGQAEVHAQWQYRMDAEKELQQVAIPYFVYLHICVCMYVSMFHYCQTLLSALFSLLLLLLLLL